MTFLNSDENSSQRDSREEFLLNDQNPLANEISGDESQEKDFFFSKISKRTQDFCCPWVQPADPKDFVLIYLMVILSVLGTILNAVATLNYIEPVFDHTPQNKSHEDTHIAAATLIMCTAFSAALLNAMMHWNLHMRKAPFSKRLLIGNAVANIEFSAGLLAAVGSFYLYQQHNETTTNDKNRLQEIENAFLFSSFSAIHGALLTCIDFSVTYAGYAALSIFSQRKTVLRLNEKQEERIPLADQDQPSTWYGTR